MSETFDKFYFRNPNITVLQKSKDIRFAEIEIEWRDHPVGTCTWATIFRNAPNQTKPFREMVKN